MKRSGGARALFFLLFLLLAAFAGWKLVSIYGEYHRGTQAYEALAEEYVTVTPPPAAPAPSEKMESVNPENGEPEPEGEEFSPLSVNFDRLLEDCPDVVAWIYCEDTPINYPVVQSEDNDYYLRRLMNGRYHIGGTLFADYRNQADFSDGNTIIYGHNMKNDSMFGILPHYQSQKFYEEHPEMYLLTPEQNFRLELVGGYVTPADSDAYVFPATPEEQAALIRRTCESSYFRSNAQIDENDRLVTLSTCVYDYDNARFVLVGVLREWEETTNRTEP